MSNFLLSQEITEHFSIFFKSGFISISIIVLWVIVIKKDLLCRTRGTNISIRACNLLEPVKTRLSCSVAALNLRHHGSR